MINKEGLLHPDYVDMLMININEQLEDRTAYSLLNQHKDLKKSIRDMQAMLIELFKLHGIELSTYESEFTLYYELEGDIAWVNGKSLYDVVYQAYFKLFV